MEYDYARVFDKEFFYFNKQAIQLTNIDENGKSFVEELPEGKSGLKLKPLKLENEESTITEFIILPDSPNLRESAPQPPILGENNGLKSPKVG